MTPESIGFSCREEDDWLAKKNISKFRFCRNGLIEASRKLQVDFDIHENTKVTITVMNMLNQPSFG